MLETKRLHIIYATEADLNDIFALEAHPANRDYIWVGTHEEHQAEMADKNHLLLVFKTKIGDKTIGYALARLGVKSDTFELRRIAISDKGMGFGREAMKALICHAFEDRNINRFWLDVYPDNTIGIRLYESLGMHKDGVLRQNDKTERGYLDQIIYSLLKSEYDEKRAFYIE